MKISKKRRRELRRAINYPILDLSLSDRKDFNARIFDLDIEIWKRVKMVLKLEEL